jgi:hypothetical protein
MGLSLSFVAVSHVRARRSPLPRSHLDTPYPLPPHTPAFPCLHSPFFYPPPPRARLLHPSRYSRMTEELEGGGAAAAAMQGDPMDMYNDPTHLDAQSKRHGGTFTGGGGVTGGAVFWGGSQGLACWGQ